MTVVWPQPHARVQSEAPALHPRWAFTAQARWAEGVRPGACALRRGPCSQHPEEHLRAGR